MTLIEVLISVTLVALLSVGMLFALHAGLGSMESIRRRVDLVRRADGAQRILEQEFASLIPVVAPCGAGPEGSAMAAGSPARFFDGEPGAVRFVSAYSLEEGERGHPQIAELFIIPAQDGRGVRLVLNERPYRNRYDAGLLCQVLPGDPVNGPQVAFPPPQPTPRTFVLADNLERVSFAYQELLRGDPFERWSDSWARPNKFPSGVRIEMVPLRSDPTRLRTLPFYAHINALRGVDE
jgi:hypothetical protein